MSRYFYELTPDRVLEAVEKGGFRPSGHCRALNSLENRVFDIGLEDGTNLVAKFYRPGRWSEEQIREEHEFLFDLAREEIPVITPLFFPNPGSSAARDSGSGNTIQSVPLEEVENLDEKSQNSEDAPTPIYFSLWPLAGGREPAEFSEEELQITGRLLGRIHNTGASAHFKHRPVLTPERMGQESLEYLLANGFIPDHLRERYANVVKNTVEAVHLLSEGVPTHRIHGDCHIGNLLFGGSSSGLRGVSQGVSESIGQASWYFLDFDDCMTGPAVQDIWMISSGRGIEERERMEIFLKAYRTFRDFCPSWLKLIEPLRSLRYIHYSAWIARRWRDPAFPGAFAHFGTEEYWTKELQDLEEQLGYFEIPGVGKNWNIPYESSAPDEPELTNKDFFWDMD